MMEIIFLVAGLVIGGIAAWFVAKSRLQGDYSQKISQVQSDYSGKIAEIEGRAKSAEAVVNELRQQIHQRESDINQIRSELDNERQQRIETTTRLDEAQKRLEDSYKNLDEQKALIEVMKTELTDTFKAHASAALKSSNEDFLKLASEHLGKILAETKGKLGEHREALDGTIKPLQEMLKRYEEQIQQIEKHRHESFGSLTQQIRSLSSMQEQLQKETSNLVTVLRRPKVSGSWGEIGLRRVAELAGMTAYCDFYEQESVSTESGRLRPDMVVRLPNGREIVVDAKAPVDAYLNAVSASSEDERKKAISNYITQVRNHMNTLGSKAYWDQFKQSPEIVVMYLPGESFFSAALEHDHKLIEDGSAKKVILSTPTTFIALLKAIAYGWQQEQVTKSAQEINNLGKDLYDRFSIVLEHFADIGAAIRKAVESYNKGVSSMESRLIPSVRKFKELGVSSQKEIESPSEISQSTKNIEHLALEFDDDESR
ncbi:MAG: DNA recombination protein RmuC [Nitrospiraceae bacterium]|nr:DNA recombination protein RmuC [Nitrospirota bacterium]MDA8338168.1 DNA recombination protein RmuC [Nitrospiraceae bacterium]